MSGSDVPYCGDSLLGVSIAFAVLQVIIVAARFYTRYMQRVKCALDDYLILVALVASLGQCALYITLLKLAGLGRHMDYVSQTPEKLVALEKGLYANQIIDFPFAVAPAKISILLFYIRIFSTRQFRILAYVVGFIVIGHGVGVFFAAIFQCSPIAYTWDPTIPGGSCFDQEAFYRYVSPPNILTDVLILVMPLPFVWRLHTHMGQKLALTGVFLLGGLGTVASILRMTTFFHEDAMTDPTWTSVNLGVWTVIEAAIVIIAACLPSIWPLLIRILPQQLSSKRSSRNRHHAYSNSHSKTKSANGFKRLGDSRETDNSVLEVNPSLESQSTGTRRVDDDDISLGSLGDREYRVREP